MKLGRHKDQAAGLTAQKTAQTVFEEIADPVRTAQRAETVQRAHSSDLENEDATPERLTTPWRRRLWGYSLADQIFKSSIESVSPFITHR